jgi:hypothetical protein
MGLRDSGEHWNCGEKNPRSVETAVLCDIAGGRIGLRSVEAAV